VLCKDRPVDGRNDSLPLPKMVSTATSKDYAAGTGLKAIPFVEGEKDHVRRHIGRDSESRYSNWAAFHFANSFDERYWG